MSTQNDPALGEEGGTTQGHREGEILDELAADPDLNHTSTTVSHPEHLRVLERPVDYRGSLEFPMKRKNTVPRVQSHDARTALSVIIPFLLCDKAPMQTTSSQVLSQSPGIYDFDRSNGQHESFTRKNSNKASTAGS